MGSSTGRGPWPTRAGRISCHAIVALTLGFALGRWVVVPLVHGQEQAGANVQIAWSPLNLDLKPRTFRVRQGPPVKTWETRAVASLQDAPVGEELTDRLYVTPGRESQFVLVLANPTDKPARFFAAPHVAAPPERSLGVGVHCLCVHVVYTVPPHKVWYRVMALYAVPAETNGELSLTHVLVGLPPKPPRVRPGGG